jgi:glutamate-1-semialdehyde 2,1-aminomutase
MAAGLASLRALDTAAIERLNRLGARLVGGITAAARGSHLPVCVTHVGSLLNLHAAREVRTPSEAEAAARSPLRRFLHLSLLDRGIFLPLRLEMCASTPMTEQTIDAAVAAVADTLATGERLLRGRR